MGTATLDRFGLIGPNRHNLFFGADFEGLRARMRIAVIGLGKLGSPLAAIMAALHRDIILSGT